MAESKCACPGCTCDVSGNAVSRDGQQFCSQACADRHPNGAPCPSGNCHCETSVQAPTAGL
ncbi:metallothionein [Pseudomonadaceae bacterium Sa2CUA2]|uniref:Metallothionein n=2 Tax=Serpens gallinarum TaxID=2763075 RepID=A0ABR8TNA7_9PSED|nr:metallothionein [Serpens gallinarum]MBD7977231.1 metallothionein [Serpens gallinarum]